MQIVIQLFSIFLLIVKWLSIFIVAVILILLIGPFWNKWVVYPRMEKEMVTLRELYQKPENLIPLQSYQGALHAHTFWSHDSRGIMEEILPAAKAAKVEFVFFSDHKRNALDSFPRSYYGIYEGVLFEAGTESNNLMVSPLKDTVLDWNMGQEELIRQVVDEGGLVLYVHTEVPHNWGNPDYQGMEIYNIHTDFLDEGKRLIGFIFNSMVNAGNYRHWAYREIFDEQTDIHALWDSLNQHRKIIGYGAPDVHNNQSLRARYLEDGRVEWVGSNAKTIGIRNPGWIENLIFGEPDEAGWVYKAELDTYFHSFHYVQTHIFADSLDSRSLKDHLVAGHAFVSFENLLEARGFEFLALGKSGACVGIMGDEIPLEKIHVLRASSPYPAKYQLIKDGNLLIETESTYEFEFSPSLAGNYRITARIPLNGKWIPWIYTNNIYIR
jgi:hypothetical protein